MRRPVSTSPSGIADGGVPSGASRSARGATLWVTAMPAIRWVTTQAGAAATGWDDDFDVLLQTVVAAPG
jgi:hypothetical protein